MRVPELRKRGILCSNQSMEAAAKFLVFSSSIFILFTIPARSASSCQPSSCHPTRPPTVRFPFWLKNRQPARCGSRGFELYCNSQNQTILDLPRSGEFVVDHIDYLALAIHIGDTGSCLPNRAMNFSSSGTPFRFSNTMDYVFFNCSAPLRNSSPHYGYRALVCLSEGSNDTIVAARTDLPAPPTCRSMANVSVPLNLWPIDVMDYLVLEWGEPACRDCEINGGICGSEGDSGLEIGCSQPRPSRSGLPRGAKYAILMGVGIPALTCLLGLACYACGLVRTLRLQRRLNSGLPITTTATLSYETSAIAGLDGPTIESFPMTVLGESRRLPKPSDATCSICLSEYEPKETLRSIPECSHYFHADCIDEWLKLNGSCPLCRKSPESSSDRASSSWTSLSSTSSSSTMSPVER